MALAKTTDRTERIVAVTAGLAATGAIVGGFCAAVVATAVVAVEAKRAFLFSFDFLELLGIVAVIGAITGLVAAPAVAWGLLRRVPLGKAILVTALGTIAGAILGEIVSPMNFLSDVLPGVVVYGWLGFVLAGVALRLFRRRA